MKKKLLLLLLSVFLIGGCSISYSSNFEDEDTSNDSTEVTPDNGDSNDNSTGTPTPPVDEEGGEDSSVEELKADIIAPITIPDDLLFYPTSLNQNSNKVKEYSYIYEGKKTDYKIYSAYYSTYYDTIYIAYDSISKPSQKLKAKDLYQIERHALHYFESDLNKTDYKDYLKAVLIYPDNITIIIHNCNFC